MVNIILVKQTVHNGELVNIGVDCPTMRNVLTNFEDPIGAEAAAFDTSGRRTIEVNCASLDVIDCAIYAVFTDLVADEARVADVEGAIRGPEGAALVPYTRSGPGSVGLKQATANVER